MLSAHAAASLALLGQRRVAMFPAFECFDKALENPAARQGCYDHANLRDHRT
jgi:hypothetical protein